MFDSLLCPHTAETPVVHGGEAKGALLGNNATLLLSLCVIVLLMSVGRYVRARRAPLPDAPRPALFSPESLVALTMLALYFGYGC